MTSGGTGAAGRTAGDGIAAEADGAGLGLRAPDALASNPRLPFELSSERPLLPAPGGKTLIVHLIVNVEYWPFDLPTPRSIVTPPHGRTHVPDIPNFSWAEYGNRCGMPRLLKLFGDRGLPASVSINASVLDVYPSLAEACRAAGWEFVGHGVHQRSVSAEPDQEAMIRESLDRLEAFTGTRPRGWMSPGWSETFDTPDLLREAGVDYIYEWVVDDLPAWMRTAHGPLIAMPYGLDLNDSVVVAIEKQSSREWRLRVEETVRAFARESAESGQPRVLTLPLHPHLIGVPHRINDLIAVIDGLRARPDTMFMTGAGLAGWFAAACPPGPAVA
jgi:hypothetical protein